LTRRRACLLPVLLLGFAACGRGPAGRPPAATANRERAAPPVIVELQRGSDPRELVRIGTRSVLIGPAPGPLAREFFADPRRADVAWFFLRTYSPFEKKVLEGELSFHGQGKVKAGPTEQRMIFEWTRQTAAAAAGGRGGTAYGLALAWHQGGSSLDCQDLAVYLTGEAVATSCAWDGEIHGRLEPTALARLYAWFDHLRPFQAGGGQTEESLRPGALETRLVFAGNGLRIAKGSRPATSGEQAEIQSFAAALYTELAARRGGVAPPPPAPPAAPGAPLQKPPPIEPSPAHLLLPPGALNPRPEEIVLQLPEKPPPPPPSEGAPQRPAAPAPAPAAPVQPPT